MLIKSKYLFLLLWIMSASCHAGSISPSQGKYYHVVNVQSDDTLSMRATPSASSTLVFQIPSDGKYLSGTGLEERNNKSLWLEVRYKGHKGWVNSRYLQPAKMASFTPLKCLGTEPYWSVDVAAGTITYRDITEKESNYALRAATQSLNHTNRWILQGTSQGVNTITLSVIKTSQCSDDMSDRSYEYELLFSLPDGSVYSGCCNFINEK